MTWENKNQTEKLSEELKLAKEEVEFFIKISLLSSIIGSIT